jgi:hypothetical protein
MKEFVQMVASSIDEADGLVKVNPTTIAKLPGHNAKAEYLEIANGKAYVFDSANHNDLSIITLTSGNIKESSVDTKKLGVVVDTAISGENDGIYILTNQPAVWFYRFDNDSLKEQPIAYSEWPTASAIGSYLSNIYLLSQGTIYKHVKNATGFSPKTTSISPDSHTQTATSIAVDGSIYLASSSGLYRYVAGQLKQSAAMPQGLSHLTNLRSTDDGSLVIGTDPKSMRVGIWSASESKLEFAKQIQPSGLQSLYNATYDPKTDQVYATAEDRLIKFNLEN